jgi:dolichyl-phosphate beta-glucosyltransferase
MRIKNNIYLSVVIPAYNEEKRIGKTLEDIISYLKIKDFKNEIIVVNDGSTDSTVEIVKRYEKMVHRLMIVENEFTMGKGYSVRRGMLESKGDLVLFTDADLSTPISEADKLLLWLGKGYDVAIGSRSMKESQVEISQSLLRRSMGKAFNKIMKLIVFTGYKDTQCGFKCFKRHVVDNVFRKQKIKGFAFDVEILLISRQQGFRIKEVPVRWRNSPYSKVHIIRDSLLMLYDLFKIRFYGLSRRYC